MSLKVANRISWCIIVAFAFYGAMVAGAKLAATYPNLLPIH